VPRFHYQRFGIRRSQNGQGSKGEEIFSFARAGRKLPENGPSKNVDACSAYYRTMKKPAGRAGGAFGKGVLRDEKPTR